MDRHTEAQSCGCGCDEGLDRREFLLAMGAAAGAVAWAGSAAGAEDAPAPATASKHPAKVRCVFIYPPSSTFADNPDGWWSWPGNEYDAEGRQKRYTAALEDMAGRFGVEVDVDPKPVASSGDARKLAEQLKASPPDGLVLILFYNRSLQQADLLLKAAAELSLPTVFFIGLGVKHGGVARYRRPGVYFIQSLDNLDAIEYGVRMISAKKRLGQSLLLSINEAREPREGVEKFFGIKVRVIPFQRYAELFKKAEPDKEAADMIALLNRGAAEVRGITDKSMEHAARAHLALRKLLAEEAADGLTMNCLRRGMLKPCVSFSMLNDALIPAACENDLDAAYTQLIGQLLTGRPGFQHNPCFETEANHYYASHCTCPARLHGPDGEADKFLLRRFAHTNEGSCAVQVFWPDGEPVTMVRYHSGKEPAMDVYAGRVVKSHPMPPAAGCTTNVEIEITDRPDACMVRGHHNLLFCGDFARRFRLFANLCDLRLADTGYAGPWPV